MANSKSNIYPIQLQNAELNLNKFDAEIKQYSGFNKNNAPFIGGCLSNLFSKDTVIEGSTYIDTDGTIYKVDSEGFYQNDKKIIEYSENTKFYKKTILFRNKNIVKAISTDIYIDIIGDSYYAHWGNGYSERIGIVNTEKDSHLNIAYKDGIIVFSYKRYRINGDLHCYLYTLIVPDETKEYCYRWAPEYENNPPSTINDTSVAIEISINVAKENPITYSQGVYIDTTGEKPVILVAWNEDKGDYNEWFIHRIIPFTLDYEKEGQSGYVKKEKGGSIVDAGENVLLNVGFQCYYMTNDGVFYFVHFAYRNNPGYENTYYDIPNTGTYSNFVSAFKVRRTGENQYTSLFEISEIVSTNTFYVPLIGGKRIRNKNSYGYYQQNSESGYNVYMPYGVSYSSIFVDDADNTKEVILAKCNTYQSALLSSENKQIFAGQFFCGDFKILVNNGNIVNISVADTQDSWHGAIIEDWNVIEDFYISAEGDKLVYKIKDTFYQVERSEPSLSLKNNQLVINCNDELNCYDLTRQIVLHFASDWNGSFLAPLTFEQQRLVFDNYEGSSYIGSAINEYNQKDNPSIILNPVSAAVISNGGFLWLDRCSSARYFYSRCMVNVYFQYGSEEILYQYSIGSGNKYNMDLLSLPYPTNTDGNIQYNPNIFSEFISGLGTDIFVRNERNAYQLIKSGQDNIMAFFLGTLVEGLEEVFVIQGQYYGIINNQIFSIQFSNGVVSDLSSVVNIQGLQFCGNTPYEALFYSATNKCLYSFSGANILSPKQFVDKISLIRKYKYNPATQSIFLLTDIGVIVTSLFGIYMIDMPYAEEVFLLEDGIVLNDNDGNFKYIKYYKENTDDTYIKENIKLETMFYGMNNQTVTINDCLYIRLFSEDHEEGQLKIKASTLSLTGRQTEETIFNIHASDWDVLTHSIYIRYQPQEQRGLGISFDIDSPFKIASMSVGSQADAILIDRVSKSAINSPAVKSNSVDW
jgi:hypothetical protein